MRGDKLQPPAELADAGEGEALQPVELILGTNAQVSFEERCCQLEELYTSRCACMCCTKSLRIVSGNCAYAVGFHRCVNPDADRPVAWRPGSLYGGKMDVERLLYHLTLKVCCAA